MLLAEEKIPLNDDAPIKLVHWQNALKEVQPDSNDSAIPPIKAVQPRSLLKRRLTKRLKSWKLKGKR